MKTEQADEPQKISTAPAALGGEALFYSDAIICYTRCYPCMFDSHYEEPTWHTWADKDDIDHAAATGQQDPSTSCCACWCAKADKSA